jgi:hypothetical protein
MLFAQSKEHISMFSVKNRLNRIGDAENHK